VAAVVAALLLDVEIPDWTTLGFVAAGTALVAGIWYAGKIEDELPEQKPYRLVQVNATGDPIRGWKFSEDAWDDLEVLWGPLYPHNEDGSKFRTYECYAYNDETEVAVGTWRRHSVPGSEMVGRFDVEDVEREIDHVRGHLEPMAKRFDELRNRLPAVVRQLDFERSEALNAALEPGHPADVARRSIDEVVRDELPAEVQPGALRNGDLSTLTEMAGDDADDQWDGDGMQLVVDDSAPADALEPAGEPMNDGGTTEP
jgi:hypothetical protein